jgi:DNA-binding CsgD family transcriptional regulator
MADRRAVHLLLARTLDPYAAPLRRLRHLAAATAGPDAALARALARAAAVDACPASASLALERAAELACSPGAAADYLVRAARHAWLDGQPHRARLLLRQVGRRPVAGPVRARSALVSGEIDLRSGATTSARNALLAAAHGLGRHDRHLAVGALLLAGEALCASGQHARFADVAAQALALRRDGDPAAVELMFAHFTGLAAMFRGEQHRAAEPLRRVLRLAPRVGDPVGLVRASTAAILLGDDALAQRLATQAAGLARATGQAALVPQALENRAYACFARGRYADATEAALEGLWLARATGQDGLAANLLGSLAVLAAIVGDRPSCLVRVREIAAGGGDQAGALAAWSLALLDLVEGRAEAAQARLRSIVDGPLAGRGHLVIAVPATVHLIEAAARCGAPAGTAAALGAFDGWATSTGNRDWLALSARCHALLAPGAGEAEERYREALEHHHAGEDDFARAHTELLFGQDLRRRRRPAAAREHLRSALETFERFDARPWREQAAVELRAAGDQVRPRAAAAGLTPQQEQIAHLVADGATNREVAAQMFLSPRTVDHHLRNIFARLGVRSRTELARLIS